MKRIGAIRIRGTWVVCAKRQKVCAVIAPTKFTMENRVRHLFGRDVVFYSRGRADLGGAA